MTQGKVWRDKETEEESRFRDLETVGIRGHYPVGTVRTKPYDDTFVLSDLVLMNRGRTAHRGDCRVVSDPLNLSGTPWLWAEGRERSEVVRVALSLDISDCLKCDPFRGKDQEMAKPPVPSVLIVVGDQGITAEWARHDSEEYSQERGVNA